jgi:hypothetical protein
VTYFPDLSEAKGRAYLLKPPFKKVLHVGWLEKGHEYPTGETDAAVIGKLKVLVELPRAPKIQTLGFHTCDFCDNRFIHMLCVEREIPLGSAELLIPSAWDVIYTTPDLIIHYIEDHNYCPPDEFVEAVKAFDVGLNWGGVNLFRIVQTIFQSLIPKGKSL